MFCISYTRQTLGHTTVMPPKAYIASSPYRNTVLIKKQVHTPSLSGAHKSTFCLQSVQNHSPQEMHVVFPYPLLPHPAMSDSRSSGKTWDLL